MSKKKITWTINGKRKCADCGRVFNIREESYPQDDNDFYCVDCIEMEDYTDDEF